MDPLAYVGRHNRGGYDILDAFNEREDGEVQGRYGAPFTFEKDFATIVQKHKARLMP
jgi:hypothetical protein